MSKNNLQTVVRSKVLWALLTLSVLALTVAPAFADCTAVPTGCGG